MPVVVSVHHVGFKVSNAHVSPPIILSPLGVVLFVPDHAKTDRFNHAAFATSHPCGGSGAPVSCGRILIWPTK